MSKKISTQASLESVLEGLVALTELRRKVMATSDTISRMFNPDQAVVSRAELEKALEAFKDTVPGFYVRFDHREGQYGLFPLGQ